MDIYLLLRQNTIIDSLIDVVHANMLAVIGIGIIVLALNIFALCVTRK